MPTVYYDRERLLEIEDELRTELRAPPLLVDMLMSRVLDPQESKPSLLVGAIRLQIGFHVVNEVCAQTTLGTSHGQ